MFSVTAEAGSVIDVTISNGTNTIHKPLTGTGSAQTVVLSAADLTTLGHGTPEHLGPCQGSGGNVSVLGTSTISYPVVAPSAPSATVDAITALSADSGSTGDFADERYRATRRYRVPSRERWEPMSV